jgi:GMP synthase (glutamine-hydrolysing)
MICMPHARLLIIEGDTAESRALEMSVGGVATSDGYADILRNLHPRTAIDIVYPADAAASLPAGRAMEAYDGIVITGSALHIYDGGPEIMRQIELVREALRHDTAIFGSCWGLQVLTVAAGGVVRRNPRGRELAVGRAIRLTSAGVHHPMYRGKPDIFDAPTVHRDEVSVLAPGSTLLAGNGFSRIQAIELKAGRAIGWATQYHPEYPLRELAAIIRRSPTLVEEGFFADDSERETYARDLDALDGDPAHRAIAWRLGIDDSILDWKIRTRELANWIDELVLPRMAARLSAAVRG